MSPTTEGAAAADTDREVDCLSVLSHAGKEAVVALLDVAQFFGEG
jgi:hypothetical protein